MVILYQYLTVIIHTIVAWVLIEVFVNNAHRLKRASYVFWHYTSVVAAFSIVFFSYYKYFNHFDVFKVTMITLVTLLVLELIIFRYLYSGDRWFLNYTDWILPMFLSVSTVYLLSQLVLV